MPPKMNPAHAEGVSMADLEVIREELDRMKIQAKATGQENDILRRQVEKLTQENATLSKSLAEKGEKTPKGIVIMETKISEKHDAGNVNTNCNNNKTIEIDNLDENMTSRSYNNESTNQALVSGILTHFQNLQINVILPTFDGERGNPLQFLEKLDKYFLRKNILENQKLLIVEEALQGKAKI